MIERRKKTRSWFDLDSLLWIVISQCQFKWLIQWTAKWLPLWIMSIHQLVYWPLPAKPKPPAESPDQLQSKLEFTRNSRWQRYSLNYLGFASYSLQTQNAYRYFSSIADNALIWSSGSLGGLESSVVYAEYRDRHDKRHSSKRSLLRSSYQRRWRMRSERFYRAQARNNLSSSIFVVVVRRWDGRRAHEGATWGFALLWFYSLSARHILRLNVCGRKWRRQMEIQLSWN